MLRRIRPRPVLELARRDLPGPLDVINLLHIERFDRYQWYGLLVMGPMLAVGGRPIWMGRLERPLHGEAQADKLLVVRYPSQRRFLAMTLNPYYIAINRLREAGVSRFEASFTHASVTAPGFGRRRRLVGAHVRSAEGDDGLARVIEALTPIAGECVYATRTVATLGVLDPPIASDPHPLELPDLALFEIPEGAEVPEDELRAAAARLAGSLDGFALQLYRRESARAYRPSLRPSAPRATEAVGA